MREHAAWAFSRIVSQAAINVSRVLARYSSLLGRHAAERPRAEATRSRCGVVLGNAGTSDDAAQME